MLLVKKTLRFALEQIIKSALNIGGFLQMFPCFILSICKISFHILDIRNSEVMVIMPEGGFGHTVTAPDVARRLFKDQRCLFVVFSEFKRHNQKIALLWDKQNVKLLFLPLQLGVQIGKKSISIPHLQFYKKFAPRPFTIFVRSICKASAFFPTIPDIYEKIPLSTEIKSTKQFPPNYLWPIGYFKLMETVPRAQLHLPKKHLNIIRDKLQKFLALDNDKFEGKLCCLYLRDKGGGVTANTRNGSEWEEYISAVELLITRGYLVLVTGDRPVTGDLRLKFKKYVVDHAILNLSKEIFYLFAATEADLFIGEAGGGSWLSGINKIPRLILNAFPFGLGMPISWIMYKTILDKNGNILSLDTIFNRYLYNYELPGLQLRCNSSQEIYDAVFQFLEESSEIPRGKKEFIESLPVFALLKHCQCKIVEKWFETTTQNY